MPDELLQPETDAATAPATATASTTPGNTPEDTTPKVPPELAYLEANLLRAHYELQSVHLGQRELARQNVELVKRKAVLVQEAADCVKKLAEAMHLDPARLHAQLMDAIQKREAQQVSIGVSSGTLLP